MTLAGLRSFLYAVARLLGDAQAVRRGRIGERLGETRGGTGDGATPGEGSFGEPERDQLMRGHSREQTQTANTRRSR
jgi:hypothetical protein